MCFTVKDADFPCRCHGPVSAGALVSKPEVKQLACETTGDMAVNAIAPADSLGSSVSTPLVPR